MKLQGAQGGLDKMANLQRRRERLEQDHDLAKFHFIATELDMALTYCEIAITTNDENKAELTAEYAKQAYEAARRFLPGARLAPQMNQEIDERLTRLQPLIQR